MDEQRKQFELYIERVFHHTEHEILKQHADMIACNSDTHYDDALRDIADHIDDEYTLQRLADTDTLHVSFDIDLFLESIVDAHYDESQQIVKRIQNELRATQYDPELCLSHVNTVPVYDLIHADLAETTSGDIMSAVLNLSIDELTAPTFDWHAFITDVVSDYYSYIDDYDNAVAGSYNNCILYTARASLNYYVSAFTQQLGDS